MFAKATATGDCNMSKKATKAARSSEAKRQARLLEEAGKSPVPELYFGMVRAIGTPVGAVSGALHRSMAEANFAMETIRLSDTLEASGLIEPPTDEHESTYKRYRRLEGGAMRLRRRSKHKGAVAMLGIEELHLRTRATLKKRARTTADSKGVGFLFRNVMHHEEVGRLRKLYDRQFFLISIYSPRDSRVHNIESRLGEGHRYGGESFHEPATELVEREAEFFRKSHRYDLEAAEARNYVTNIPKAFQHGDLFVDAADPNIGDQIDRFVNLIFDYPFHTPTRDEVGMADAFSAALQSGNLARQVGAAICTESGDLISTGTNDVPKPGGGVYRSDDAPDDYRDHNANPPLQHLGRGFDVSDPSRRAMLDDLLHRMIADPRWLDDLNQSLPEGDDHAKKLAETLSSLAKSATASGSRRGSFPDLRGAVDSMIGSELIWGAQLFDVLEYGRTMHAEMDAITSAARKGVSVEGATLYCTTLPCHECARLIIGAGIRRVIYIEPYEKSRSESLFDSEIHFTTLAESRLQSRPGSKDKVDFVPYVGISPRRFAELFVMNPRKLQDQDGEARTLSGERARWSKADGRVRETIISRNAIESPRRLADTLDHERQLIDTFRASINRPKRT